MLWSKKPKVAKRQRLKEGPVRLGGTRGRPATPKPNVRPSGQGIRNISRVEVVVVDGNNRKEA